MYLTVLTPCICDFVLVEFKNDIGSFSLNFTPKSFMTVTERNLSKEQSHEAPSSRVILIWVQSVWWHSQPRWPWGRPHPEGEWVGQPRLLLAAPWGLGRGGVVTSHCLGWNPGSPYHLCDVSRRDDLSPPPLVHLHNRDNTNRTHSHSRWETRWEDAWPTVST